MRRTPYTAIGISRVPCLRCGRPSSHQWNICALGRGYWGVCDECDVGLNDLVLKFMRHPERKILMEKYAK